METIGGPAGVFFMCGAVGELPLFTGGDFVDPDLTNATGFRAIGDLGTIG